jgi:F-type H+-transporting ATPase subunit delta
MAAAQGTGGQGVGAQERHSVVARNYAEALLSLARKAGDVAGWGRMMQEVADAVANDAQLRAFLESPRVPAERKNAALGRAFQDRYPRLFVRFLQTLVAKGRQRAIGAVASEYAALVDAAEGRVHAQVTLAQPPSAADQAAIAATLSRRLGLQVVPHVTVRPEILGGVIVRVGDRVMDGSVRRRLGRLRHQLTYMAGR